MQFQLLLSVSYSRFFVRQDASQMGAKLGLGTRSCVCGTGNPMPPHPVYRCTALRCNCAGLLVFLLSLIFLLPTSTSSHQHHSTDLKPRTPTKQCRNRILEPQDLLRKRRKQDFINKKRAKKNLDYHIRRLATEIRIF